MTGTPIFSTAAEAFAHLQHCDVLTAFRDPRILFLPHAPAMIGTIACALVNAGVW